MPHPCRRPLFVATGWEAKIYLIFEWGRFAWTAYAFISGPLILIGALFLLDWLRRPTITLPA
ncbi:MAG: hypothetical protein WA399_21155 [Acidobacteriaceae bacterium]